MPPLPPRRKDSEQERKIRNDLMKGLSMLSQIGITIIVCVLIGVFFGRFLDSHFGTSPWFLLVFTLIGVGAAFKYLYDLTMRM